VSVLEDLITELARLPGIGRKTAQRLTYHLLRQPGGQIVRLAECLQTVAERVAPCSECGMPTEHERCGYCSDPRRDDGLLCVVEEPSGVDVVERSTEFRGRYLVLGGHLSPLDGIGPDALRLDPLIHRVRDGRVREVILATNPSMEGEATATYIQQLLVGAGVKVTRLARGLPMGGDLEYVDGVTLSHALLAREEIRS
jgi:recombination protein RecR